MIECVEWRVVERGSLRGFAKIEVPSWKLTIDDVAIHSKNGKQWAALPARPMLDENRNVVRDDGGKVKYARTMYFTDRDVADRFSSAVVDAVDRHTAKKPAAESDELSNFTI